MRTFDARLSGGAFLAAVIVPPAAFLLIVQGWANGVQHGELTIHSTLFVVALAQLLPCGALLWMIFSTAAYSVGSGKLVVHSVVLDREFSLQQMVGFPQLHDGVVTICVPRRIRLRVDDPQACWLMLLAAAETSADTR